MLNIVKIIKQKIVNFSQYIFKKNLFILSVLLIFIYQANKNYLNQKMNNFLQQMNQSKFNSSHKKSKHLSHNQTLQELLETQTIIYGNDLSNTKKNLFLPTQLSFFSNNHTYDHTNQQGYEQVMKKIHFQRSRNRQLNQSLTDMKQGIIEKYLNEMMEVFKNLSEENKTLRDEFRKECGRKRKKQQNANNLVGNNVSLVNNGNILNSQTPRNLKTRRSIAGGSVLNPVSLHNNSSLNLKPGYFKSTAFVEHKKSDMPRQLNKQFCCQSSIDIHAVDELQPSLKKHKRRESQLTQRKDYPNQNDYLEIFDDNSQMSFDQIEERMSQQGIIQKMYGVRQNQLECQKRWLKQQKKSQKGYYMGNTMKKQQQAEYFYQPTTTKNIFIQFLQQLLLEEKVLSTQMLLQIDQNINQLKQTSFQPSYHNLKHIETLQQQIMQKNFKLKQLQNVTNIFKQEIEQIMGTDIKQINQLVMSLLEVKGKYIEMQEKVHNLTELKQKFAFKEQMKIGLLNKITENKKKKEKQNNQEEEQPFAIPQSIKTLFEMLEIKMKKNSKPVDYLHQIKELEKNKQLFQAFHSNKRSQAHGKVRQIIDSIRQGRKKFNQVIKIYQNRIIKLQQKIQKYKIRMSITSHHKINQIKDKKDNQKYQK